MNESKINNFEAYKKTKMPVGKPVTYELCDLKPDPDNKGLLMGSWKYIRPFDTIEHKGEFFDIGIVRSYNTDGSYVLNNEVSFIPNDRFRVNLTPGNPVHEEIYKFFEWCNENESNPNRRADVEPVFKKINAAAFAISENEKARRLFEAQQIFYSMKDADIKNVANLLGIPSGDEIDIVKSNVRLKVENNTDLFLKVAQKPTETLDELVLIKEAIKRNILKVNKELKEVSFGDDNKVVSVFHSNRLNESELLDNLKEKHPEVLEAITAQLG